MSDFTDAYVNLLIKQYWEQPNARAEIAAQAGTWEDIRDGFLAFGDAFDIDHAVGAQLDILGKVVGIPRIIPFVIPKIAFGFSDNPDARGFGDKFEIISGVVPFLDKFEPARTPLELADADYRQFIRARIAANVGGPYMVSDVKLSLQDVINTQFGGEAYVIDKQDMSLVLYVSPTFDTVRLQAFQQLDLLPKPQGVRYALIIQGAPGATFGFSDNPDALGFGAGLFANKVI